MWTSRNGPVKQRNTAQKDTETKGLIQQEGLNNSVFGGVQKAQEKVTRHAGKVGR